MDSKIHVEPEVFVELTDREEELIRNAFDGKEVENPIPNFDNIDKSWSRNEVTDMIKSLGKAAEWGQYPKENREETMDIRQHFKEIEMQMDLVVKEYDGKEV